MSTLLSSLPILDTKVKSAVVTVACCDQTVVAGSEDGELFVWDHSTSHDVELCEKAAIVLEAGSSVNALRSVTPHLW